MVNAVLRIVVNEMLPHVAALASLELSTNHGPAEAAIGDVSGWICSQIVNPGRVTLLTPVGTYQRKVAPNRHAERSDLTFDA